MTRLFLVLSTVLLATGVAAAEPEPTKPNIVLILADDQGWADTGVRMDPGLPPSGNPVLRTPTLARLATEGMCFSRVYAPSPVCSPTRASLQTGVSPAALRWTKAAPSVDPSEGHALLVPTSLRHLPSDTTTIGELLRKAGYRTAHFGKWHCGGGGPGAHGYDVSDGDTGNRDAEAFPAENPNDVFGMSRRAVQFIEEARRTEKPFFVQLSCYALHYPERALPETIAHYREAMPGRKEKQIQRAAMTENLDSGLEILLDALDRLKVADSTYVIYTTDNGGGGGGGRQGRRRRQRLRLRGGKGSLYEGGIRVPFLVRGPTVPAGKACDAPISLLDLLPTFAAWAGALESVDESVEGVDVTALLLGETASVKRRRSGLYFHFPHYQGATPQAALVDGDWKLIYGFEDRDSVLFDLGRDLGETNDLSETEAARTASMEKRLLAWLEAVEADLPSPNPKADPERAAKVRGRGRGKQR